MADARDAGRRPRKTVRPVEASPPVVAVIDRKGMVVAVIAGHASARTFLRGGCA